MVLADQLCVLIQENLLPLGEFFRALLPVATPPTSNHVAWLLAQVRRFTYVSVGAFQRVVLIELLSQCAIPDEAKEVIISDVGEASGDLLTLFMSFVCAGMFSTLLAALHSFK